MDASQVESLGVVEQGSCEETQPSGWVELVDGAGAVEVVAWALLGRGLQAQSERHSEQLPQSEQPSSLNPNGRSEQLENSESSGY